MSEDLELSAYEIVGSPLCVASDDGQLVHDRIAAALREGRHTRLSFRNVTGLTSAFLNAAIGQLYGEFKSEEIRVLFSVEGMEADDLALLKRVVETAKVYFKDPKRVEAAVREVTGSDE